MKKIFYIYKITCQVSGHAYIGKTGDINWRWWRHRLMRDETLVTRAMRKYGQDVFTFEVLACCFDESAAFQCEKLLIKQHGTRAPNGYNLTDGGEGTAGYNHTDEARRLISASSAGRKYGPPSVEKRAKISAANRGRSLSKETRAKLSAAGKGRVVSEETRAKISAAQIGKKRGPMPEEWRRKISARNTGSRKGHVVPQEVRDKISAKLTGRKLSPEHVAQMRGRPRKPMPAHVKEILRAARAAKGISVETRIRIKEKLLGYKHSPEARRNMSIAVSKSWAKRRERQLVDALIADQARML